jgi:PKD repeat protein
LSGSVATDDFFYDDISTGNRIKLPNGVRFLWSSNPSSVIPFPDSEKNPQTFTPPLVDVTYNLQVSDSFGCVSESSFFYESIHVKAEFTADPVKGGAPLEVLFTDKSIRGNYKYTWNFGEKTPDGKKVPDWVVNKDSLFIFAEPVSHKYYIPGE